MTSYPEKLRLVSPEELKVLNLIKRITNDGKDAEVRKRKDGTLAVYEISKKAM